MTWYQKFRNELLVGGADEETVTQAKREARWVGILIVGLLAWLGVKNPWALVFVIGLVISIFLHELGHFVSARKSGMKVTEFAMGFGPRVWSTRRGEVEYSLRSFPLGAFVRIVGMNSEDEVDPADESRAYRAQSYPKRLVTITAGSIMHMAIAAGLIIGVYSFAGRYQETGRAEIMEAPVSGTAAYDIGLRKGDVVVEADGTTIRSREDFVKEITSHEPGDVMEVVVRRDGKLLTLRPTLGDNGSSVAYLGVFVWSQDYARLNPAKALWWGAGDIVDMAASSVRGVITALNPVNNVKHLTNSSSVDQTSRPTTVVGATQFSGTIGRDDGWRGVLRMLAGVNVFVGIFNMFPLLPFDGGHAAIATYERLRSRKGRRYFADVSKMIPVTLVLIAMLAFLFLTGLYMDITDPIK